MCVTELSRNRRYRIFYNFQFQQSFGQPENQKHKNKIRTVSPASDNVANTSKFPEHPSVLSNLSAMPCIETKLRFHYCLHDYEDEFAACDEPEGPDISTTTKEEWWKSQSEINWILTRGLIHMKNGGVCGCDYDALLLLPVSKIH